MELVEVVLTPLQRRNRAAFVSFDDLGRQQMADSRPQRALDLRERVVLRDENGDYFGGSVIDTVQVIPGVDSYLIRVGVRLPEEWALLRLGKLIVPTESEEAAGVEVIDMLELLRAEVGSQLPVSTRRAQRRAR